MLCDETPAKPGKYYRERECTEVGPTKKSFKTPFPSSLCGPRKKSSWSSQDRGSINYVFVSINIALA